MVKISVIIPVYNAEKYITKCLNSIINQTFKDFEIICVNDNSNDNSISILNEYSQKDERIKIINNTQNIGAALTRNKGISVAQGEYIYFIDADDYIDEKYLENMYNTIEKESGEIVLNLSVINESNGVQHQYKHPSMNNINCNGEFIDKISIIHDAPCFIWARMYRKSFLNKHNLEFLDINATDDVVFNSISTMFCEKTYVFFGENYHYTINNTGVTGVSKELDNRDLQHIKAYDLIFDYLKKFNMLDNRLKLFRVYPFFKVDNKEKFDYYKTFIEKIKKHFYDNESIYNEMEKYFAYSIIKSSTYEEYIKNYNKVITIGFIKQSKN